VPAAAEGTLGAGLLLTPWSRAAPGHALSVDGAGLTGESAGKLGKCFVLGNVSAPLTFSSRSYKMQVYMALSGG